jgi:hypothetical protein
VLSTAKTVSRIHAIRKKKQLPIKKVIRFEKGYKIWKSKITISVRNMSSMHRVFILMVFCYRRSHEQMLERPAGNKQNLPTLSADYSSGVFLTLEDFKVVSFSSLSWRLHETCLPGWKVVSQKWNNYVLQLSQCRVEQKSEQSVRHIHGCFAARMVYGQQCISLSEHRPLQRCCVKGIFVMPDLCRNWPISTDQLEKILGVPAPATALQSGCNQMMMTSTKYCLNFVDYKLDLACNPEIECNVTESQTTTQAPSFMAEVSNFGLHRNASTSATTFARIPQIYKSSSTHRSGWPMLIDSAFYQYE